MINTYPQDLHPMNSNKILSFKFKSESFATEVLLRGTFAVTFSAVKAPSCPNLNAAPRATPATATSRTSGRV